MNVGENMTDDYKNQLKILLRKLFQFDSADLDFGIYRIMNKKRDEIERFIEEDLIDAVEAGFGEYSESKGANLKDEIEAIKAEIYENLGEDALDDSGELNQIYVTTPFAKKLAGRYEKVRAAMKDSDMSDQQEAEIFSHIYQFFSRYYDNGDFMSLRRYSQKEKYAIPYNGEEVVLHWANKDQYYIKTGEYFRNYSFKMGEYTVEFRILEAEGTTNNNKAEKRFFVLASSGDSLDYDESNKTLTIFFEYRGLSKDEEREYGTRNVQDAILAQMKEDIPAQVQDSGLKGALNKVVDKSKETEKTVLEKHLRAYTKKNTTDYFIHKDLKGFLTRELDFYIKNEVFHLDDLGTENEVSVEQYVSRVRVMKSICLKVIDFLAQIEDFQKMLFEKKKFVVKTDYCMTLDNVPEELYPEIVKNEQQLNEWNILYGIGEEKQSTLASFGNDGINEAYLKENPYLVIDTKFFGQEFKDRLLSSFDDINEAVGGLMVNSENWQALNLMQEKYKKKVKCIYIDPPYNSKYSEILYKNTFKHSSWLSLMENRIFIGSSFLKDDGILTVAIDENEQERLGMMINNIFPDYEKTCVTIVHNPGGIQGTNFSYCHEFAYFVYPTGGRFIGNKIRDDNADIRPLRDVSKGDHLREDAANCFYPIIVKDEQIIGFGNVCDDSFHPSSANIIKNDGTIEIYPIDTQGNERKWVFARHSVEKIKDELTVQYNTKREIWDIIRTKTSFNHKTVWSDKEYNSNIYGSKLLNHIMGENVFSFPKSLYNVKDCILANTEYSKQSFILDYFAGSGTTAHAVLNINKENSDNRKYILVEMGDYFDTITKPRIQKVMYSDNWKDGKPQSKDGISHIFMYQSLEQYEDTLNNIEFTEAGTVQRTLADMDGYFLRYMLDFETRDSSPCRFNVEKLTKPFDYTLKISQGSELKEQTVDLVETFNYLLGLHVRQIRTFTNNGTYYRVVLGTKNEDDIAVIWRDTEDLDLKEDKTFIEGTILSELNPTKTYINSDFYVEGAHPIEPEFKKLMVG